MLGTGDFFCDVARDRVSVASLHPLRLAPDTAEATLGMERRKPRVVTQDASLLYIKTLSPKGDAMNHR